MNAVVYDTYHASDDDIVNDNISPSSTNNVTHGDNHPLIPLQIYLPQSRIM